MRGALILMLALAGPAAAQDPMQLGVNRCMVDSGPAGSPRYDACIARMCTTAAPAPADDPTLRGDVAAPAPPAMEDPGTDGPSGWTVGALADGSAFSAGIRYQGRGLDYLCRAGGPALIGLSGMRADGSVTILVDGQRLRMSFVAQDDVVYAQADPGSSLLAALMGGRQVTLSDGSATTSLPLTGSRAAIQQAMRNCGLLP